MSALSDGIFRVTFSADPVNGRIGVDVEIDGRHVAGPTFALEAFKDATGFAIDLVESSPLRKKSA
jgi:hypothetical protein